MAIDLEEVTYLVGEVRCDMCGISVEYDDEGLHGDDVLDDLADEGWRVGGSDGWSALCPDCHIEEEGVGKQEPERRFAGRELYGYEELGIEPFDPSEDEAQ